MSEKTLPEPPPTIAEAEKALGKFRYLASRVAATEGFYAPPGTYPQTSEAIRTLLGQTIATDPSRKLLSDLVASAFLLPPDHPQVQQLRNFLGLNESDPINPSTLEPKLFLSPHTLPTPRPEVTPALPPDAPLETPPPTPKKTTPPPTAPSPPPPPDASPIPASLPTPPHELRPLTTPPSSRPEFQDTTPVQAYLEKFNHHWSDWLAQEQSSPSSLKDGEKRTYSEVQISLLVKALNQITLDMAKQKSDFPAKAFPYLLESIVSHVFLRQSSDPQKHRPVSEIKERSLRTLSLPETELVTPLIAGTPAPLAPTGQLLLRAIEGIYSFASPRFEAYRLQSGQTPTNSPLDASTAEPLIKTSRAIRGRLLQLFSANLMARFSSDYEDILNHLKTFLDTGWEHIISPRLPRRPQPAPHPHPAPPPSETASPADPNPPEPPPTQSPAPLSGLIPDEYLVDTLPPGIYVPRKPVPEDAADLQPPDSDTPPPPPKNDRPPRFRENNAPEVPVETAYRQGWETRWDHLYYLATREKNPQGESLEQAITDKPENPQTQHSLRLALLRQAIESVTGDEQLLQNPGLAPIAFAAIANNLFLKPEGPSGLPPLNRWPEIEVFLSSIDLSPDSAFYSRLKEAIESLLATTAS